MNGVVLDEPYLTEKSLAPSDIDFPYQVPENRYFVLGDHRSVSIDSRSSTVGCVSREQLISRSYIPGLSLRFFWRNQIKTIVRFIV